ncbi:hypothetical protein PSHT_12215, partial [Puccinia striiformis]
SDLVRCNSNKSEDRHVLVNFSANGASEELKQALSLDSLFGLKGLVAVVTGGGTGIGLMCTQALAAHGARVYITGRREEVLKQAVDNYHKHAKGKIIGLQADVTNKADLERIIGKISEKEPNGIQILVQRRRLSVTDTRSMPLLEKGGDNEMNYRSGVVNITSIVSLFNLPHDTNAITYTERNGQHITESFPYNASKAAAIHLTKALKFSLRSIRMMACELANSQIRFNSIAPARRLTCLTLRNANNHSRGKSDISESFDASKYKIPAGRPGRLQEMAASILYHKSVGVLRSYDVACTLK